MRVMCLPDLHCFYESHSQGGPNGVSTRLADWNRSADDLVRIAREFKPHLILAPGDFFVTGNPPTQAVLEIITFVARLEAVAPVVGIQGNHDPEGWLKPGPVDLLRRFGDRWGYTTPQVVDVFTNTDDGHPGPLVQVAVLPWTRPDALRMGAEHQVGNVQAALSQVTWGLAAQCKHEAQDTRPQRILLGHWAISGCKTANNAVLEGREPALMLTDLQAQGWDLVVMGHIHTPQVFPGTPIVLHTGALEQRDFGEEGEERGVYLVDTEAGTAEFRRIWHRRFWTWRLDAADVDELAEGTAPDRLPLFELDTACAEDAICRVVYKATAEQHAQIDEGALVKALRDAGAAHVAGVFPEIIRATRTRSEGLTEHTQPPEALAAWLAQRSDLSPDLKAKVKEAAEQLEREVQGGAQVP